MTVFPFANDIIDKNKLHKKEGLNITRFTFVGEGFESAFSLLGSNQERETEIFRYKAISPMFKFVAKYNSTGRGFFTLNPRGYGNDLKFKYFINSVGFDGYTIDFSKNFIIPVLFPGTFKVQARKGVKNNTNDTRDNITNAFGITTKVPINDVLNDFRVIVKDLGSCETKPKFNTDFTATYQYSIHSSFILNAGVIIDRFNRGVYEEYLGLGFSSRNLDIRVRFDDSFRYRSLVKLGYRGFSARFGVDNDYKSFGAKFNYGNNIFSFGLNNMSSAIISVKRYFKKLGSVKLAVSADRDNISMPRFGLFFTTSK